MLDPRSLGRDVARLRRDIRRERAKFLPGYENDAILLRAVEVGCSAFLTKGQDVATLLSTLRAADAGEALIPPNMLRRRLPRLSPTYRGVGRDLTAREIDVLTLLAEGLPNREIAAQLGIQLTTARNHVQHPRQARRALEARSGSHRLPTGRDRASVTVGHGRRDGSRRDRR